MKELLLIKEKIKQFAGKYDIYIIPVLKFLLVFLVLGRINGQIGFMARLTGKPIALIIALAGSFLPLNLTMVILSLIIVAHVYALSLECAILVLALFIIMFLLYFRFSSKDSVATLLMPLAFAYKMPYVIPVSMGLVGTPSSMVSVGCGTVVYQVLHYISVNAESLKPVDGEKTKVIDTFKNLIDGILLNKAMILYVIAFAATVLIVYIIRRLSINYSWWIAIAAGSMTCFVVMLLGNAKLGAGVSMGGAFFGILISIILNIILQYFCFDLDYNRTERVQFEDDEYYYYVKAVPKNTVKLPEPAAKKAAPVKKTAPAAAPVKKPAPTRVAPSSQVRREIQPARRPAGTNAAANPNTAATARDVVRKTAIDAAKAHSAERTPNNHE